MTDSQSSELRAAYRTLNEPTRLLGFSIGGWATLLTAGATGYGWLLVSPLAWRANVSLAAIVLGLPASLILLREQSTITPARLLVGVVRWRVRASLLVAPTPERPVRRGGLRLDRASATTDVEQPAPGEDLLWPEVEPPSGGAR